MQYPRSIISFFVFATIFIGASHFLHAQNDVSEDLIVQNGELSNDAVEVVQFANTLWLKPQTAALQSRRFTIPRLCAPLKSIAWKSGKGSNIKFVPEITEWVFSWKGDAPENPTIEVVFDEKPVLPKDNVKTSPAGDGSIMLRAHDTMTFGEKLRYEPQWYKNTVGYWTIPTDYATWQFNVDQPGRFTVAVLQGCGKGQGGSDATITIRSGDNETATLPFKTLETGHFQNFRWNHLGEINIDDAGDYELKIAPTKIAKNALFDVRIVHLVRQAN